MRVETSVRRRDSCSENRAGEGMDVRNKEPVVWMVGSEDVKSVPSAAWVLLTEEESTG